jgi:hypothetical protein
MEVRAMKYVKGLIKLAWYLVELYVIVIWQVIKKVTTETKAETKAMAEIQKAVDRAKKRLEEMEDAKD